MIQVTINGIQASVPEGVTVLSAARTAGVAIPTLCHHPRLTPFGGCRLCIVEIKGIPRPVTACTTPVTPNMEIQTHTPLLEKLRTTIIKLLLSDHPMDCLTCDKSGGCELQDLARMYGVRENEHKGERRVYQKQDANPFLVRDMEKCVMCGRCVKICEEIQGVSAINFAYRGFKSKICPPYERDLDCEFCGQCVSVCPTGALTGRMWDKDLFRKETQKVDTVCSYCGTGCRITLHVNENRIVKVDAKSNTPNDGLLCVKGRFGYGFVGHKDRLKKPLIKKDGKFTEVSWDEAVAYTAARLKEVKAKHGADAIGGLSSARCTNEDNYVFQKFIRAGVGTNNVDHCARL